jgi:activator of 2-hydroxyglutaryl-CoA dehydratase
MVIKPEFPISLGIDFGSTGTKATVVEGNKPVWEHETKTSYDPIQALLITLDRLLTEVDNTTELLAIVCTGSGRGIPHAILKTLAGDIQPLSIEELISHSVAARNFLRNQGLDPDNFDIFEIGGQDSKIIHFNPNQTIPTCGMNSMCQAGTGALLDSLVLQFNTDHTKLDEMAQAAPLAIDISAACGVLLMRNALFELNSNPLRKSEVLRGIFKGIALNYLSAMLGGSEELSTTIVFQGGVARFQAMQRAFREAIQERFDHEIKLVTPPQPQMMGAIGAALLGSRTVRKAPKKTIKLESLKLASADQPQVREVQCQDCPNRCQIKQLTIGDRVVVSTPGQCGKQH